MSRPLLTIVKDSVTVFQSRKQYFERTGQTAPPCDYTKGFKFWIDPGASVNHVEYEFLNFDPNGGGGDFDPKALTYTDSLPKAQAQAPNFPDDPPGVQSNVNDPIPWPVDLGKLKPGEVIQHDLAGYQIMTPGDVSQTPQGQAATLEGLAIAVGEIHAWTADILTILKAK